MQGDIKQAAKWMAEGKQVRRAFWGVGEHLRMDLSDRGNKLVVDEEGYEIFILLTSLLAEDWEVVDAG